MPREITLEDAGLFQMVCHLDGIAHPPGYPLFTLLCKPFVHLPFWGDVSVMPGNLLSALLAAASAAVFHHICFRLTESRQFAYVAAFAYAFSTTFWSQAIIIEVYSLAALMFMICWAFLLAFARTRSNRYWFLFCFSFGLALSNHWPLMILSTPGLAMTGRPLYPEMGRLWTFRFAALSGLFLVLGLLPYVSLVTNQQPEIAMVGAPSTLTEFADYVSRSIYAGDDRPAATLWDRWLFVGWLFKESALQLGIIAIPVIALGIAVCLSTLPVYLNLALLLTWGGTTVLLNGLLDFDFDYAGRAVFRPYPVIAYTAVAFWFAMGIHGVTSWLRPRTSGIVARGLSPLLAAVAIVAVLLSNAPANDRSEDRLADRYGRTILRSLPRNGVVFLNADHEVHVLGYLHYVEKLRPDLELRQWTDLVFANRLGSPFDSDRQKFERVGSFIAGTDRPVFSLSPIVRPATNYGGYFRYNRRGVNDFARRSEMGVFQDHVLDLYLSGQIDDLHEFAVATQLIVDFTRHHAGWLFASPGACPEAVRDRLERLQETFPGKMVTLEVGLDYVGRGVERDQLLTLARMAGRQIPDLIRNARLAAFYELYGRAMLIAPADRQAAAAILRKSIEVWPAAENGSICRLYGVLRDVGDAASLERLENRFPRIRCRDPS